MAGKTSRTIPSKLDFCRLADGISRRATGAATQEQTPPDKLPAPKKMSGIGTVQMKITATLEAEMWFNQGLNLLHDFWDYESARAFEQAIRVDPRCAMCYWGLYEAESFYHGTAPGYADPALDKALSIKHQVSKRERLYIEATAASRDARKNAQSGSNSSREVRLWRKLVEKYPKDTEALLFLAQHTDRSESLAILQSVLKDDPENSAAHHYYIHALEASEHPEQALHSAEVLPSLAPASGHMVHMPGHIFFRIGEYGRAERAFAASMQIDERYMREQKVQPDYDWNYVHNLMYAVANLLEEGKLKEATALSAKLTGARGQLENTLYPWSPRDSQPDGGRQAESRHRALDEAHRGARRTGAHVLHLFDARFDFASRPWPAGSAANGRLGPDS